MYFGILLVLLNIYDTENVSSSVKEIIKQIIIFCLLMIEIAN